MYRYAVGGYMDIYDVPHDPLLRGVPSFLIMSLPALPFTLASPALGLLLVFRTNASYARWVGLALFTTLFCGQNPSN